MLQKAGLEGCFHGGFSFPFLKERPGKLMTPVSAELETIPELSSWGTPPHSHSYFPQEPQPLASHRPLQPRETVTTIDNCAEVYPFSAGQHPEGQRSKFQWPQVAPRASPLSNSLFWRQGLFWGTRGNMLLPAHGQVCFPN